MACEEVWKPISRFEGLYSVSTLGNVYSFRSGRLLTPVMQGHDGKKYPVVALYTADHKRVQRPVHQLVLEAFVGPRLPGTEACHEDDITTNNKLTNLRWGTKKENAQDRLRNGNDAHASLTHCPQGHPYEGDNLLFRQEARGVFRICKTCRDNKNKARYPKKGIAKNERE
jgi:hypothetical protein